MHLAVTYKRKPRLYSGVDDLLKLVRDFQFGMGGTIIQGDLEVLINSQTAKLEDGEGNRNRSERKLFCFHSVLILLNFACDI